LIEQNVGSEKSAAEYPNSRSRTDSTLSTSSASADYSCLQRRVGSLRLGENSDSRPWKRGQRIQGPTQEDFRPLRPEGHPWESRRDGEAADNPRDGDSEEDGVPVYREMPRDLREGGRDPLRVGVHGRRVAGAEEIRHDVGEIPGGGGEAGLGGFEISAPSQDRAQRHKALQSADKQKQEVKIADFGVSRILSQTLDPCNTYVGTCAYMSPERFDPETYGGRYDGYAGDIWSLGLSLLECYIGHFPFLAAGQKADWPALMCAICFGDPPSPPPTASAHFRSFITCCLHKDARNRWTAAQLLAHPFPLQLPPNTFHTHAKAHYLIQSVHAQITLYT
jgi:hypothetical protein